MSTLKVGGGFFSQEEVSLFSSVTPTNVDPLGRPTREVELPGHIMHRFHAEAIPNYDTLGHDFVPKGAYDAFDGILILPHRLLHWAGRKGKQDCGTWHVFVPQ
jgi:hypothetical protein